ncbi:hypothetical protein LTR02_000671 [Friedmanniomyces endolithicus]|nr:hypothetical protein LTR94_001359 [Friedmanniomyces endolithicus]KAK0784793.1 hypothetical protein LTR38_012567 [Friedmanniomyces endolithicus]KAK0800459.1 hypothetical protein LTR59_005727 [Friedmanniomyces endolithicus]KAK0807205.1 hypothetical protein LTR75_006711 [Friedmanniomyces endolithicus]KAK0845011.1 hypothetical protein LTR03_007693 [Friedmanniomyces endolithicus]
MVSSLVPPKIASPNTPPIPAPDPANRTYFWNMGEGHKEGKQTDSAQIRPSAAPPTQLACKEWSASTRSFRVVRHRSQRRGVSWSGTA